MTIKMIYRADLRIRSKADALEFYEGVKSCTLIPVVEPHDPGFMIRVEPNRRISMISKQAIAEGKAWMLPSFHDEDGSIAYSYRKHINAYLAEE